MRLFVLTLHCTSRAHCKVCRSLDGGRLWRQKIGESFELPAAPEGAKDAADFECPYGVPWGELKAPMAQSTPAPVRAQVTTGCKNCSAQTAERERLAKEVATVRNSGSRGTRQGCGCSRNK